MNFIFVVILFKKNKHSLLIFILSEHKDVYINFYNFYFSFVSMELNYKLFSFTKLLPSIDNPCESNYIFFGYLFINLIRSNKISSLNIGKFVKF